MKDTQLLPAEFKTEQEVLIEFLKVIAITNDCHVELDSNKKI